jgi:hypothetical protein
MLDPIKTAGKLFKSRVMHLTEWEAGILVISAVALNIILIAAWAI